MNKVWHRLTLVLCLAALPAVVWLVRAQLSAKPKVTAASADYNALAEKQSAEEVAIRDELNHLISHASAPLEADDAKKVSRLTRECLDVKVLLEIKHVRAYLAAANRGEASPYHFVSADHRARLQAIAGEKPSPQKVLAVRKGLVALAKKFEAIRQPPDWSVKVEGDQPPPMPFLDLLRETHELLPAGKLPELRAEPRFFAFSGAEGELLVELEQFFNSKPVRAAFPEAKYPKLYRDGRIPAIPATLIDYRKEIGEAVVAEQKILLPDENPDLEEVAAVNEVFAELEQFFSAIAAFRE